MQTGLAVGDTQAEREKAEFTQLKFWVSNACYDTFNTFSSILMILAKVPTCMVWQWNQYIRHAGLGIALRQVEAKKH